MNVNSKTSKTNCSFLDSLNDYFVYKSLLKTKRSLGIFPVWLIWNQDSIILRNRKSIKWIKRLSIPYIYLLPYICKETIFAKRFFSINFMSLTFVASWNERHERYLVTKSETDLDTKNIIRERQVSYLILLQKKDKNLAILQSRSSWALLNKWHILLYLILVYKTNCNVALSRFFQ